MATSHPSIIYIIAFVVALSLLGPVNAEQPQLIWQTGYHAALDDAEAQRKMALLWFFDPQGTKNDAFEADVLGNSEVRSLVAAQFSAVKLPLNAKIESEGQTVRLMEHPAFAELRRAAGLAIIDMTDPDSPHFRQVVSIYPLARRSLTAEHLALLLQLPRGSLTQRTLVFAVRTHPERPASTSGHLSSLLTRETENHAWHQASIHLQGHHNWNTRFHAINAELPGGLAAREVCAESWPGQSLFEAAEECVDSWRQSSGHWEAVSSKHTLFAYDMKRGNNGIWYAAGIFAGR